MRIDKRLIERISGLARLELKEGEKKKFVDDFKDILGAFKVLDKIKVKEVKSSFQPVEERNIVREDKAERSISQKEALRFTKNKEKGFFVGPKTIEQ